MVMLSSSLNYDIILGKQSGFTILRDAAPPALPTSPAKSILANYNSHGRRKVDTK